MKYLELYEKWAADDFLMPVTGLCFAFGGDRLFERMEPTGKDYDDIDLERDHCGYWGSGESGSLRWQFTPLRQNIVLFMAAMNGEL